MGIGGSTFSYSHEECYFKLGKVEKKNIIVSMMIKK